MEARRLKLAEQSRDRKPAQHLVSSGSTGATRAAARQLAKARYDARVYADLPQVSDSRQVKRRRALKAAKKSGQR